MPGERENGSEEQGIHPVDDVLQATMKVVDAALDAGAGGCRSEGGGRGRSGQVRGSGLNAGEAQH